MFALRQLVGRTSHRCVKTFSSVGNAAGVRRNGLMLLKTSTTAPKRFSTDSDPKPKQPLRSPMELISEVPPIKVKGSTAVCDGGGGALGHPRVYVNVELPGPHSCGYCGLRFEQDHHH